MKVGANSLVTAALTLGILVVLNFFSSRHYVRYDMTENQDYTLSAPTRRILAGLGDIVTVKVYLSAKPPTEILELKRRIEDTVSEFQAAGGANIRVEYLDPKDDEEEREQAEKWGIEPLIIRVQKPDRVEQVKTYLAMAILYEDKREVIPGIGSTNNLEYNMIASIKKVVAYAEDTLPQVAFLGGHKEPSILYGEYSKIAEGLKKIAHATTVNPSLPKDKEISNEENSVLVVAAPQELGDRDLYAIDQFLMKGGSIIFLVDPLSVDFRSFRAEDTNSNLDEMLAHYGVLVNHDLIVEDLNFSGTIQRRRGPFQFREPYPLLVNPAGNRLSRKNPVTASIDRMVLPWASSIEPLHGNLQDREVIELAWTSDKAWTQEGEFDVQIRENVREYPPPTPEQRVGKRLVAIAVQGKFTSFFQDKEIPPILNRATQEPIDDDPLAERVDEVETGQILVVGDTDFLKNNNLAPGNAGFFLNAIEWLALNPDLVTIRGKGPISRELDPALKGEKGAGRRNAFKFFNLIGIPALVALLGLLRYGLRRGSRRRYLRKLALAETTSVRVRRTTGIRG